TLNGKETAVGVALMLLGENSRAVADRVDLKMKEVNRSLPPGVAARTLYTRTKLVDATIDTVKKNLFEGALLVMAILFALLGNWRAALITTLVIPLSMMFAITVMVVYLPILTLQGVEGKMFVPMAATVLLALLGAMIFSLTFVPAAIAIWIGRRLAEKENVLMRNAKRFYVPLLDWALQKRG